MYTFSAGWLPGSAQNITTQELERRLANGDRPVMVDVRTQEEFEAGHIPGSVLIPLDQLAAQRHRLNPADEIILVCRSGSRSMQAYHLLAAHGFQRLRNLTGGMLSWRGAVA